jgi:hypothetical protein
MNDRLQQQQQQQQQQHQQQQQQQQPDLADLQSTPSRAREVELVRLEEVVFLCLQKRSVGAKPFLYQ